MSGGEKGHSEKKNLRNAKAYSRTNLQNAGVWEGLDSHSPVEGLGKRFVLIEASKVTHSQMKVFCI